MKVFLESKIVLEMSLAASTIVYNIKTWFVLEDFWIYFWFLQTGIEIVENCGEMIYGYEDNKTEIIFREEVSSDFFDRQLLWNIAGISSPKPN